MKKKYVVSVTKYGENSGEPFENHSELVTWAANKEEAERNAKYRTEGHAYRGEVYGNDNFWFSYSYDARLIYG